MIVALLAALALLQVPEPPAGSPPPLSPFELAKAEWLLRNRLPCLGCHELGGQGGGGGGAIGPSLSALQESRTREYVAAIIENPQRVVPGTVMPRVPMTADIRALIAGYLMQRQPTPAAPRDRAAATAGPLQPDSPAAVYARFCSACHGERGHGDGYNAEFLPVPPTRHADAAYMSRRPDDALFDAVWAGGYVMNRSHFMPPFGETLSRSQIGSLVRYMRVLCECEGPAWSRDLPATDRE